MRRIFDNCTRVVNCIRYVYDIRLNVQMSRQLLNLSPRHFGTVAIIPFVQLRVDQLKVRTFLSPMTKFE